MNQAANTVLNHLTLEKTGQHRFTTTRANEGWQRVFGGQLMAQAVNASSRVVPEDKFIASFQATFIARADINLPINYEVRLLREGRQFTNCEVHATQSGNTCFVAKVLHQKHTEGLSYQADMPQVSSPESCPDLTEVVRRYRQHFPTHIDDSLLGDLPEQAIETRFVDLESMFEANRSEQMVWLRFNAAPGNAQARHREVLSYISDQALAHVVAQPHGLGGMNPALRFISLDHSMWFHRLIKVDDWLLLKRSCLSLQNGRALVSGEFYSQEGDLVANIIQQASVQLST